MLSRIDIEVKIEYFTHNAKGLQPQRQVRPGIFNDEVEEEEKSLIGPALHILYFSCHEQRHQTFGPTSKGRCCIYR
jgi:hypothetical protein